MDAPPVNRLLQLLRQRPSDTPDPAHVSHNRASPRESTPPSIAQSDIQPATGSDTLETQESSTQPATESDTQPAQQSNIQPAPKGSTQRARSSTQPATESDTQKAHQGNTLSATQEDVSLAVTCLLYTSPSPRDRQKSRMPSSA